MSDLCGEITKGIGFECVPKLFGGVKDRLILGNFNDIESIIRNGLNPQIIEGIILASGKNAFVYQGKNNSIEPIGRLVKLRFTNVYDHEVRFKAFEIDGAAKLEYERLADGLVFAIVENKFKGPNGESAFEIYGLDTGLEVQELERALQNADTQGAFDILLRSSEQSKEAHLPATFFLNDLATTKALVEGLL